MAAPDSEERDVEEGSPPLFSTWNRIYAFVAGFLFFLIFIFYLFTRTYQPPS
jgi:hypothetical protein